MSAQRRGFAAVAIAAMGALALTACGGTAGDGDATKTASGNTDTITIGIDQAPDTFNTNTAAANSVYNAWVDNATQGMFLHMEPDGTLVPNTEFGKYEKVSDDPLTIEYSFDDKAVWSDGVAIDCDDALLFWAARSTASKTGEKDEEGNDKTLFLPAGTNGYEKIEMPSCKSGDKAFTFKFTEYFGDWETLMLEPMMPAHVVAKKAGMSDADDGKELIDAITTMDITKLTPAAKFWNEGWVFGKDLASIPDLSLLPTSGYYKYKTGTNGALSLEKNDKWWGTPAKTQNIVYKKVLEAELVRAMENGEVDVFQPSAAQQDMVAQLEKLGDKVKFETASSWSYSHIDLDQSETGVFNDIKVREAFLKCVPRQELVDKFVTTVYPDGVVLNSHEYFPSQDEYKESLAAAPSSTKYDLVDLEGAKALLAEAGKTDPVKVRLMRAQQSELRGQQVQLIKASCDQVGFVIEDLSDADWSSKLSQTGAWDAVVFGWAGSGIPLAAQPQYVTGGAQNFGKYSNATVDELWGQLTTATDSETLPELKFKAEEQLWADPYNVLLYANPTLQANVAGVSGPVFNPTQYGPSWNVQEWTKG